MLTTRSRLLPLTFVLTFLGLASSAASATAATAPPTLTAPTSSEATASPLAVSYELPEAAGAGTVRLTFSKGASHVFVTLADAEGTMGKHSFSLDVHNLTAEPSIVVAASEGSLPDGEYSVRLSYQDVGFDPAASVEVTKVTLQTVTQAPSLTSPPTEALFDKAFDVEYTLPEAALAKSVKLLFNGEAHGLQTIKLENTAAGSHTIVIDPSNPGGEPGVESAPASLPFDTYTVTVSYQDALSNPEASSSPIKLTIAPPLCVAGAFSESGREPCVEAPAGTYVEGEGATSATECIAGTYNPESGSTSGSDCLTDGLGHASPAGSSEQIECEAGRFASETHMGACAPARPGHHVSGAGAIADEECEPGTFAASSGSTECMPAPAGSYVESAEASTAKPCPAGTFASVSRSVHCTQTPVNTYATGGAIEPTPCPTGTEAPAGASSCTTISTSPPGTSTITTTIGIRSAVTFTLSAPRKQVSLRRTRAQIYVVGCSAAEAVIARVSATIRVGRTRVRLTAASRTIECSAGKTVSERVRFKLNGKARRLLARRGAKVTLSVVLYPMGAATNTSIAKGSVRGKR